MSGEVQRGQQALGQWLLTAEMAPGPPVHVASCVSCEEESDGADGWDGPRTWCLRHAAATGHTINEATVTSFLRASLQKVLP